MSTRNMYFAVCVQVTDATEGIDQQDEVMNNMSSALSAWNDEGCLSPAGTGEDNDPGISYVKIVMIPPMNLKPLSLYTEFGKEITE